MKRAKVVAALIVIALGVAALAIPLTTPARADAATPAGSRSYYVTKYDTKWAYRQGCSLGSADRRAPGTQRHVVVLDFGYLYRSGTGWKLSVFSGKDISLAPAGKMIIQYASGYWACTGSDRQSTAYIGFGANNSAGTVARAAGAALAVQVTNTNRMLESKGYYRQAAAIGASDFEAFGASAASSKAAKGWIAGYNSRASIFFVNYGSADGCPANSVPKPTSCNVGLSAEAIWAVSYSGWAWPLPEIYTTNGIQAKQWRRLSEYSLKYHHLKLGFQGVMTQRGACMRWGGCRGTDNTPSAGWSQLNSQLNSNNKTALRLPAPTDIWWK